MSSASIDKSKTSRRLSPKIPSEIGRVIDAGTPDRKPPDRWKRSTLATPNRTEDVLLTGPHSLAPAERELIATHVSATNNCVYCAAIHSAIAAHHLGGDDQLVTQVKEDFRKAPIPARLKALLSLAGKVQGDGENVSDDDIHRARLKGATELEIRDTVLIASMFCMCNGNGWRMDNTTGRQSRASAKRKLKRKTNRKEK
jgi:uncharacterized peroxidase-related enzyme